MRRLLPLVATALVVLVPAQAAVAKVRKGPSGNAFYTPPSPLPGKNHGDLIWARKITGDAALKGASAELARPLPLDAGRAASRPRSAASCHCRRARRRRAAGRPSRGITGRPASPIPVRRRARFGLNSPGVLATWLKKGYAIVGTDYQGLGTPGTHRYLGGVDEGRSTLDIVRAARQLDPRVGKTFAIAGHSQGGHAALWAADLAPKWTPDLKLRGTVGVRAGVAHLRADDADPRAEVAEQRPRRDHRADHRRPERAAPRSARLRRAQRPGTRAHAGHREEVPRPARDGVGHARAGGHVQERRSSCRGQGARRERSREPHDQGRPDRRRAGRGRHDRAADVLGPARRPS